MTEETKTQKMLERVRALLAKANDHAVTPEEAESFRAKADELMTRFAIDQFMVDQAEAGRNPQAQAVERRDFSRSYGDKFWYELESMFHAMASHCRCVVGHRGISSTIPVFGLPSDMDYLDMLMTTVALEVAKSLTPEVDPAGEIGHEVFKQRQAGIDWSQITRKVYKAGLTKLTKGERRKLDETMDPSLKGPTYRTGRQAFPSDYEPTWEEISQNEYERYRERYTSTHPLGEITTSIKNRLANANRRYVKEHGLQMDRNYVKPEVFQRSFIEGFRMEIGDRLRAMSRATRQAYDQSNQAESFAVAVRDVRAQAMALYEEAYPPPPPVVPDPNYKAPKYRAVKVREVAVDYGAVNAGRRKAASVNLSNNPSQRVGGQPKHIDS